MTETFSFEEAYKRLEVILEQMNSGKLSLDASLKFYEEADSLIKNCMSKLSNAEQKIEKLIKNREGSLSLDANHTPQVEPFSYTP